MWGALLVAVVLVTVSVAESAEIVVGGTIGWTTGFDYDAWVTSQNIQFRVGDVLVFRNPHQLTHTLALVPDANSYQRCVVGAATNVNPVPPGRNFTFAVPASLEGATLYVICTISGHCLDMQKFHGTVLAALANSTGPTAGPSPPPLSPQSSDADMNRYICWTTAILLIAACFWNSS